VPLDQAEELVRLDGESADALSDFLRASITTSEDLLKDGFSAGGGMLVLTVRSDSFAELQKSPRFDKLDARCADIRPMPLYRFDAAIEGPAERYGVQIDPDLVEAIIGDAPGEDTLPLLAFALQRLWNEYHTDNRLDRTLFERLGAIGPMIDDAAERALRGQIPGQDEPLSPSVPSAVERLAAKIFVPPLAQVSDSGATIRKIAPLSRFDPQAMNLIDQFVRWRILVKKPSADQPSGTIEVTHEVVFRSWLRLQRWVSAEKIRMQVFRDLETAALEWNRRGYSSSYLNHRGSRLKEATSLLAVPEFKAEITSIQIDYLQMCHRAELKRRAGASALMLVLLTAIFFTVNVFHENATRSNMLSTADNLIRTGLPLEAGKFAVAAAMHPTDLSTYFKSPDETDYSLADTGFSLKELFALHDDFSADSYVLTADGTRMVTKNADGAGAIWNVDTGSKVADLGGNGSVKAFEVTKDQTRLVLQSRDNGLSVWDLISGKQMGGATSGTYATGELASSPNRLVTLSDSGTAMLWNIDTGAGITQLGEANEIARFSISASPPRVITTSRNNNGMLWDSTDGKVIADLERTSCSNCFEFPFPITLVGRFDSNIETIIDLNSGRELEHGHLDVGARTSDWRISADGAYAIIRSVYNQLTLWNIATGSQKIDIGNVSNGQNYEFSPSGRQFILKYANSSGELHASKDGSLIRSFQLGQLARYKFSKVGNRLVTVARDLAAALWNSETGDKLADLAPAGVVDSEIFSPDGTRLSIGSATAVGALWDARLARARLFGRR
jgi:WD40 repeat protein